MDHARTHLVPIDTPKFWSTVVYTTVAKAYMISTGIRPNVATESQYTYMIMLRRILLFFNNIVGIAPGTVAQLLLENWTHPRAS